MKKTSYYTKGFTLIDILISTAIISFLSSAILFNVSEAKFKAQDSQMKAEASQVATAIEIYKTDHAGRTPISVWSEQSYIDPNIKTGQLYNEGTPEYTEIMNTLVKDGYLSAVPKSPDTTSYAYGESTDGTQAIFATRLKSGSNISSNTKKSCDFIEPVVTKKIGCVQGQSPVMRVAPLYEYCKYLSPQFSTEDLQGDTYIATLTSPAGWDCSKVPLNSPDMTCQEWSSGTLQEECTTQGYTWELNDGVSTDDVCIEPDHSKGYMCMGYVYNPPPCDYPLIEPGYTCTNISDDTYEICPITEEPSGNLCDGSSGSDYCTCI
jgi:type II secretory pathway pseudopilin PulG